MSPDSKRTAVAAIAILVMATCACAGNGDTEMGEVSNDYLRALERHPGSSEAIEAGLESFEATFHDLGVADLESRVTNLYAERFHFNDTIHTFEERDQLVAYLARTGKSLEDSRVEIHQIVTEGADVFVRWTMMFKTRVAGRQVKSESIGMSHLRFDAEGRIVIHQDYWDSGNALYAHLPVVGFFVRRARASM